MDHDRLYAFASLLEKYSRKADIDKKIFNSLEELYQKKEYLRDNGFKEFGLGSGRTVYLISPKKVLKLAHNDLGRRQNSYEARILNSNHEFFPKLYDVAPDFSWIEVETVKPFSRKNGDTEFKAATGIDIEDFQIIINGINNESMNVANGMLFGEMYYKSSVKDRVSFFNELKKKFNNSRLLKMLEFCVNNDISITDLKPGNLGVDSNGLLVILDAGYTGEGKANPNFVPSRESLEFKSKNPRNTIKNEVEALNSIASFFIKHAQITAQNPFGTEEMPKEKGMVDKVIDFAKNLIAPSKKPDMNFNMPTGDKMPVDSKNPFSVVLDGVKSITNNNDGQFEKELGWKGGDATIITNPMNEKEKKIQDIQQNGKRIGQNSWQKGNEFVLFNRVRKTAYVPKVVPRSKVDMHSPAAMRNIVKYIIERINTDDYFADLKKNPNAMINFISNLIGKKTIEGSSSNYNLGNEQLARNSVPSGYWNGDCFLMADKIYRGPTVGNVPYLELWKSFNSLREGVNGWIDLLKKGGFLTGAVGTPHDFYETLRTKGYFGTRAAKKGGHPGHSENYTKGIEYGGKKNIKIITEEVSKYFNKIS